MTRRPDRRGGCYALHDRIGGGGMGAVHLGQVVGAGGFTRLVAIKRLRADRADDPEFVTMLLDEARLAGTVRHPNVVATLDVVAEGGELCVVMEYVEGESLSRLMKLPNGALRPVSPPLAAAILAQVLHGLHAAHEVHDTNGNALGIVHRDVSPANIIVGVHGVAKILDFGIAKASARAQRTDEGQIKGKPGYLAPEQIAFADVDRRADIFAASVVLWELLTGRRLFEGSTPAASIGRVVAAPIDSPARWVAGLPDDLVQVVMRGLSRSPSARYQTAAEMAVALERAVPLARAVDIAGWVRESAGTALLERANTVRRVECRSDHVSMACDIDTGLARIIDAAHQRVAMQEATSEVGVLWNTGAHRAETTTRVSTNPDETFEEAWAEASRERSSFATAIVSDETSRPKRRFAYLRHVTLGAFIAGVIALQVVMTARRTGTPTDPSRRPAQESVDASVMTAPAVTATPPPVEVEPALAQPAPLRTSQRAAAVQSSRSVLPARRSPGSNCSAPFSVKEDGRKHFKVECL